MPDGTVALSTDAVEIVTTLRRLDEKLAEIEKAWSISDDAARAIFASFEMKLPPPCGDPWSVDYRNAEFDLYRRISTRADYITSNEVSGYAVNSDRPFPYYTESPSTVGDHLIAVGYVIKTMGLPAGSSILELGPGWGNTTIALARMGYDVTALDIDNNFVDLIRERCHRIGLSAEIRVGEFFDICGLDATYDAVLFYECFHHCSDHVRLLNDLHRVLNPGGRVWLAAEPIFEGFRAPWGLRLDGESLWAIRENGWLELGFTESYFIETCMRQGWLTELHQSDVSPLTRMFSLRQIDRTIQPGAIRLPPADEQHWAVSDGPGSTQRYTGSNSRLVCPVGRPWHEVAVSLRNSSSCDLPFTLCHGQACISGTIAGGATETICLPYSGQSGALTLETKTWQPAALIPNSADARVIGLAVLDVSFS